MTTTQRFDHKYEPGDFKVCRRCGADHADHEAAERPRALNGDGKAGRLIVSLAEADRIALITLAESRGVSQAEVVRDLIREEAKRGGGP